ncbi:MAG TPA: flagellar FliJ family protein [Nocardioidaceae bacterium]|nr:flagellar FliJ family protein [Nocardioidaceae bacterium]
MSARADAGMRAVSRVREIRERDSRIGVQQAAAELRAREATLADLQQRAAATQSSDQSIEAYLRSRDYLTALGEQIVVTERSVAAAATLTDSALAHWRVDRTRLGAVELLLERRAEVRRQERALEESKRLDEAAALLWQRRQGGAVA